VDWWEKDIIEYTLQKALNCELGYNFPIELVKARSGIYENNEENRKLGRVGQEYGEKKKRDSDISAGIVIIQDNKILLVHPKNASWWGTYSIPKGMIEKDEALERAALRETEEETGIKINKEDIKPIDTITYKSGKKVHCFLAQPMKEVDVKKFKPNTEVDWMGFLTKEQAEKRILPQMKDLLKLLK